MNVYLTGGLGYVGGRCSQHLASRGVYNLKIGSRRAKNIPKPEWLVKGDLDYYDTNMSIDDLSKALDGIDVIVHLASPNEHAAARDPESALRDLPIATLRLCQAAVMARVSKVIFFSTAHVYSSPLIGEFDELSLPKPSHPYAYAHLSAEYVLRSFAGQGKIPNCIVIRLANGFGAPERLEVDRWTLLVNDLCSQATRFGNITLQSNGQGLRDFICLSDVSRAVEHLIGLNSSNSFEVFNLGSGSSITVLEMAKCVQSRAELLLGKKIPINLANNIVDESVINQKLSISNRKLINSGFNLQNDVNNEIDKTISLCATR